MIRIGMLNNILSINHYVVGIATYQLTADIIAVGQIGLWITALGMILLGSNNQIGIIRTDIRVNNQRRSKGVIGRILVLVVLGLLVLGRSAGIGDGDIGSAVAGDGQLAGGVGDLGDGSGLGHGQLSASSGLGHGDALHGASHVGLHVGSGHFQSGNGSGLSNGNGSSSGGLLHGYGLDLAHNLNGSGGGGDLDGLNLGGLGHGHHGILGLLGQGHGLHGASYGDRSLGSGHGDGSGHGGLFHSHLGLGHDDDGVDVGVLAQRHGGALSIGDDDQAGGQLRALDGHLDGGYNDDQALDILGQLGVLVDVHSDLFLAVAQLFGQVSVLGGQCRGGQHTQHKAEDRQQGQKFFAHVFFLLKKIYFPFAYTN